MRKLFFVFAVLIFTFNSVSAQDKVSSANNSFSLGVELSFPVGMFGNVYSLGVGGSAQKNFALSKNTALTLQAGYINYISKSTYGSENDGYIPVLAGIEENFSQMIFASVQAGLTLRTKGLGNAFSYAPGMGLRITRNFSALLKYYGQSKSAINSGAIGLRAAYNF